jgi:hypothetical protein
VLFRPPNLEAREDQRASRSEEHEHAAHVAGEHQRQPTNDGRRDVTRAGGVGLDAHGDETSPDRQISKDVPFA